MSSMESAPASIPATSAVTFNPAFAPKYPDNVNHRLASSARPVETAKAIAEMSPAADMRLVSSKVADRDVDLWNSCDFEMSS